METRVYRHEKSLKMSANQIFLICTVQTFFENKLPIYDNVGEETDQNVYICRNSLLIMSFLPSIWSICSISCGFIFILTTFKLNMPSGIGLVDFLTVYDQFIRETYRSRIKRLELTSLKVNFQIPKNQNYVFIWGLKFDQKQKYKVHLFNQNIH